MRTPAEREVAQRAQLALRAVRSTRLSSASPSRERYASMTRSTSSAVSLRLCRPWPLCLLGFIPSSFMSWYTLVPWTPSTVTTSSM